MATLDRGLSVGSQGLNSAPLTMSQHGRKQQPMRPHNRITRRQAQAWLAPMRSAFVQMKTGETDAIRGYAVTRLHNSDQYERTDYCIAGFKALIERLFPEIDVSPLNRVERKLASGIPLTIDELNDCLAKFNICENNLVGMPRSIVIDAVITEQVMIEVEKLGLKEAA